VSRAHGAGGIESASQDVAVPLTHTGAPLRVQHWSALSQHSVPQQNPRVQLQSVNGSGSANAPESGSEPNSLFRRTGPPHDHDSTTLAATTPMSPTLMRFS
jgi:hypothetical protein